MTQRVKICGLTRYKDARLAAELGAWALGFIFYPKSLRYIKPSAVRAIIQELQAENLRPQHLVGVFVNAKSAEILKVQAESGIDCIQLHGDESPALLTELNEAPTIKAFRLENADDVAKAAPFSQKVNYFLVDAAVAGAYGGTGHTADWSLALQLKRFGPLLLSGGLHAGNVADAIRQVEPFAVDLASGVEEAPGIKSPKRLKELFAAIRTLS